MAKNAPSTEKAKRGDIWKADYEVKRGRKDMNQFLAAMDTGLSGVYFPEVYTVTFKRGVKMTKARAEKVCDQIKDAWNKQPGVDCASVKLLQVYLA